MAPLKWSRRTNAVLQNSGSEPPVCPPTSPLIASMLPSGYTAVTSATWSAYDLLES